MKFYLIRHKASNTLMPQARKNRGYSHWNPSTEHSFEAALDVPRLMTSRKSAEACISQWVALPNGRQTSYTTYDGEWDDMVDFKEDGRTKNDLEVIEADLCITEPVDASSPHDKETV